MARGDQLARQWMIFQTLASSRYGKSVSDLSRDLSCSSRTVYRDLEALQVAGFPIYDEKNNGKKVWCLLETARNPIPIPFNLPELTALYFGRDVLKVLKDTVFYDSLESLYKKIHTTVPSTLKKHLSQIEGRLRAASKPFKAYGKCRQIIEQINDAVTEKRVVEINYYTMSRKRWNRRRVDPYMIWFFDNSLYLIGYCEWRKDIRIFAIDRIKTLQPTDEEFRLPVDFDISDFMRHSFGVFHGKPEKIQIHFTADVAGYITEKTWHASQQIQELDDGSILFTVEVPETEEIKSWIMRWGTKACVLEPATLRQEIQSEAVGMVAIYENGKKKEVNANRLSIAQ
ncbi:MAG: transcriptional regulator [Desulfobacterales bacterium]